MLFKNCCTVAYEANCPSDVLKADDNIFFTKMYYDITCKYYSVIYTFSRSICTKRHNAKAFQYSCYLVYWFSVWTDGLWSAVTIYRCLYGCLRCSDTDGVAWRFTECCQPLAVRSVNYWLSPLSTEDVSYLSILLTVYQSSLKHSSTVNYFVAVLLIWFVLLQCEFRVLTVGLAANGYINDVELTLKGVRYHRDPN